MPRELRERPAIQLDHAPTAHPVWRAPLGRERSGQQETGNQQSKR
jgi:hypothetical protein